MSLCINVRTKKWKSYKDDLLKKVKIIHSFLRHTKIVEKQTLFRAIGLCVFAIFMMNACFHTHHYFLRKDHEQVCVINKWGAYVQQIERHATFMVSVLSSINGKKLISLSHSSPYAPQGIGFMEYIHTIGSKNIKSRNSLYIETPFSGKAASYVVEVPLKNFSRALGVASLTPQPNGILVSPWGRFDYVSRMPSLGSSFITDRASRVIGEIACLFGVFCICLCVHIITVLYTRRFLRESLTRATQGLERSQQLLKEKQKELSLVQEKIELFRKKDAVEREITNFLESSQKRQKERILAFATLLSHDHSHNEIAQELLDTATKLNAGSLELSPSKKVSLFDLLENAKTAVALDYLRSEVTLTLDDSIRGMYVIHNEFALLLYMICALKTVERRCFKRAEVRVTKSQSDDNTIIISLTGNPVPSQSFLYEKDFVIGGVNISHESIELLCKDLSISVDGSEKILLLKFNPPCEKTKHESPHYENVVPLFA